MTYYAPIPDFQLANPLYIGATITFYEVTGDGVASSTLAPIFSDPQGTIPALNPQTLDSEGKFVAAVYTNVQCIGSIVGSSVASHLTGVIGLSPNTGNVNVQLGGVVAGSLAVFSDASGYLLQQAPSVAAPIIYNGSNSGAATAQIGTLVGTSTSYNYPNQLALQNENVAAYAQFSLQSEFTSASPISGGFGEAIILSAFAVASYGDATGGVDGNASAVVPMVSQVLLNANNAAAVGINVVIQGISSFTGTRANGIEVDFIQQAGIGLQAGGNIGLLLQAGNNTYDDAIAVTSFFTGFSPNGYWTNGLLVNFLASGGCGVKFGNTISTGVGVYSGTGTFSGEFIQAETNQNISFGAFGAANTALGRLYFDGTNLIYKVSATGAVEILSNDGTKTLASFPYNGAPTFRYDQNTTTQATITNGSTGLSAAAALALITGTLNSNVILQIDDAAGSPFAFFYSGSAVTGIALQFASYNFESQSGALWASLGSGVLTLGNAGTLAGGLAFKNATSGSITIVPPAGALGSAVLTLQEVTDTLAVLGTAQTFTAAQTFAGIHLDNGTKTASATTGAATLNKMAGVITSESIATAAGSDYTLTLTNSDIAAADQVFASAALGSATTGEPCVTSVTPAAGSAVIKVRNIAASAAFNGTIAVAFAVLKN